MRKKKSALTFPTVTLITPWIWLVLHYDAWTHAAILTPTHVPISPLSINSFIHKLTQLLWKKPFKPQRRRASLPKHKPRHYTHMHAHTRAHTTASNLPACQHTKRLLCPLITLVQPSLQEAVFLTSLPMQELWAGGREQNNALSRGGRLLTRGSIMKSMSHQPFPN